MGEVNRRFSNCPSYDKEEHKRKHLRMQKSAGDKIQLPSSIQDTLNAKTIFCGK